MKFISNTLVLFIYFAIFCFTLTPFFGCSWKTAAGGYILTFFAEQLNNIQFLLKRDVGEKDGRKILKD